MHSCLSLNVPHEYSAFKRMKNATVPGAGSAGVFKTPDVGAGSQSLVPCKRNKCSQWFSLQSKAVCFKAVKVVDFMSLVLCNNWHFNQIYIQCVNCLMEEHRILCFITVSSSHQLRGNYRCSCLLDSDRKKIDCCDLNTQLCAMLPNLCNRWRFCPSGDYV